MNLDKKYLVLAFLGLLLFSAPSYAQNTELCRLLEKYKKPSGVEYQPGIDVDGNAVVPADLNQAPNGQGIYDEIIIPIELDLLARYNRTAPAGVELKPTVADMTLHKDGRISYNGQDLTPQAQAMCDEEAATTPPAPQDGQGSRDDIKSPPVKTIITGQPIEGHNP